MVGGGGGGICGGVGVGGSSTGDTRSGCIGKLFMVCMCYDDISFGVEEYNVWAMVGNGWGIAPIDGVPIDGIAVKRESYAMGLVGMVMGE